MFSLDLTQIEKGDTVGVALSGGKDSVCLLHALFAAAFDAGIKLVVINVEHGIRGEASRADSAFSKDLAEKYGLPFFSYAVDAVRHSQTNGCSLEESARILRYECFFKAINERVCDKIAVAHHLSDNVETILFNLFRGASLSGVKGISKENYDGKIIRPLLSVTSEEVSLYVQKHRLSFVQDATNFDPEYTRNALRIGVLPRIKELFPKAEQSIARFAALAAEDDDYLYSLAHSALIIEDDAYKFAVDTPAPIAKRCVVIALKALGVSKDYEAVHVSDVLSLKTNITGKRVTLPRSIVAVREHDVIAIRRDGDPEVSSVPFALGTIKMNGYTITCEKLAEPPKVFNDALYFDLDKLPIGALFRIREVGDGFTKFDGQRVSLKKYLTDCKFSESRKRVTPLIAYGKTIYCVCEKDISSLIKIDKNTVNIIKLTCKKQMR